MCSREQLKIVKKKILEEVNASRDEAFHFTNEIKDMGGVRKADVADSASSAAELEFNALREKRADDRVEKLRVALYRIDRGWDGMCIYCGSDIPLKRLMVCPDTNLCTKCKGKMELFK